MTSTEQPKCEEWGGNRWAGMCLAPATRRVPAGPCNRLTYLCEKHSMDHGWPSAAAMATLVAAARQRANDMQSSACADADCTVMDSQQ